MRSSQHSPQPFLNSFRLLVVCDPVAQASCLVTFIPHSNDRPRGAVQNVAVSPQPSSAIEFLAQKDVSRIKVCGNVLRSAWLRLKFKPGRPELCQRWADQNQRSFCTSFAHDACALKPGPAEALLRDNPFGRSHLKSDARVDTSTARYIRCLCPPNAPRSCHPNQEQKPCAHRFGRRSPPEHRQDSATTVFQLAYMTVPLPPDASFGACVRGSPLWRILRTQACNVRTCNGIWQVSHLVVVSDSQLFLSTHSHGQATGLHNDVRELRRHDVRLSESIQLVLIPVEIHVDGKITTGIEGLRKKLVTSGQTSGAPVALMRL